MDGVIGEGGSSGGVSSNRVPGKIQMTFPDIFGPAGGVESGLRWPVPAGFAEI
jgi:hypothetical protein